MSSSKIEIRVRSRNEYENFWQLTDFVERCRGFGFLKFHDSEAASRFREEWRDGGLELDGYPLRVDHSRDHANDAGSWTCDNVRMTINPAQAQTS